MGLMRKLFAWPKYIQFLTLSRRGALPFWNHSIWSKAVAPCVTRLFDNCASTPSVRSRQILRDSDTAVKLGRLDWSEIGHKRWCHGSEFTADHCNNWVFVDAEVFCPPRSQLITNNEFPMFYIHVEPMLCRDVPSRTAYDSALLLAVRQDYHDANLQLVEECVKDVAKATNAIIVYRSVKRVSSLNEFESLVREGFLYSGMLADEMPVLGKMKGKWQEFIRS